MSVWIIHLSLFLTIFLSFSSTVDSSTPYFSLTTLSLNYQNMLKSFKVFVYNPPQSLSFSTRPESLFFSTLLNSSFVTRDPEQAHLFFIPFSSSTSTRSLSRVIRSLRKDFPFWDRTLGADHFYISCKGLGLSSDRNIVELKKNSVQISCFPAERSKFTPHKDVTLAPLAEIHSPPDETDDNRYIGYVRYGAVKDSTMIQQLRDDPEVLVESEPSDALTYNNERIASSKFCLFQYGEGDFSGFSDAVRFGCVPVVITDRPIQDLPLIDVLRWQDIAAFVQWNTEDGTRGLKRELDRTCGGERYKEMRSFCVTAGQHLVWNAEPQPYDAFHMVMYQLWTRRHTIRYARREITQKYF